MAYIIHFIDENNPHVIKEEIYLWDSPSAPTSDEIEEIRTPGYDTVEIHNMGFDYFPGSLPCERGLRSLF